MYALNHNRKAMRFNSNQLNEMKANGAQRVGMTKDKRERKGEATMQSH